MPSGCWRLLRLALAASIIADLWFTMYHRTATWPNMLGHFFLVASALLIFRALVDDGLARPHVLAVRNLSEAEAMHRRLERGLMPSLPVEREGLSVISESRPGERHLVLSGDFIDVLDRGPEGVAVICGDVTGHGANAAALGTMLRASWEALNANGAGPIGMVESLHTVLERERQNPATFATMCLAWLDPSATTLRLLNLGHPLPLLIVDGEVSRVPVAPMPPLGTFHMTVADPQVIELPESWQLLFYTDGLVETHIRRGSAERFGEDRLIEAVKRHTCSGQDGECLKRLLSDIEASSAEPFTDDVTAVLITKSADRTAALPPV